MISLDCSPPNETSKWRVPLCTPGFGHPHAMDAVPPVSERLRALLAACARHQDRLPGAFRLPGRAEFLPRPALRTFQFRHAPSLPAIRRNLDRGHATVGPRPAPNLGGVGANLRIGWRADDQRFRRDLPDRSRSAIDRVVIKLRGERAVGAPGSEMQL